MNNATLSYILSQLPSYCDENPVLILFTYPQHESLSETLHALPIVMTAGANLSSPSESGATKKVAGLYDWYQEGENQDPASIETGMRIQEHIPNAKVWVHENRAMVNRAIRWLARNGVTQVVDLGSGKPSPHGKSTHEAVNRITPEARVLYVEIEETAVVEGKKMIDKGNWSEKVAMIHESALNPASIMSNTEATRIIDWDKPVVLIMSALIHFFRPEQYRPMMAFWRANLRRDSALIMTHGSFDEYDQNTLTKVLAHYERMGMEAYLRSKEELIDVMEGWELMKPGLVRAGHWKPEAREVGEDPPSNFEFWWVAVARL